MLRFNSYVNVYPEGSHTNVINIYPKKPIENPVIRITTLRGFNEDTHWNVVY